MNNKATTTKLQARKTVLEDWYNNDKDPYFILGKMKQKIKRTTVSIKPL